ncbi:hypothetical protein JCM10213_007873 [Rhodosporidiobolus nylandii]
MEANQEYHFSRPEQFWDELEDLISVSPDSTLEELDYALRNYIAFASTFMDQFLAAPGALDHALLALLSSPLFTSHIDRMTQSIISSVVSPSASSSTLFISLMLVLHLGESANPLTTTTAQGGRTRRTGAGVTVGSSKVFRAMRRRWKEVVSVLMKWVSDAAVVEDLAEGTSAGAGEGPREPGHTKVGMPAEGWEERVGTAATAVLYELCRVQKLSAEELSDFTFPFVSHLFTLVERTRDVEDETFNYSLIKLIIALNEQFMVATVPSSSASAPGPGAANLPPPILPTVAHSQAKRERGPNLVLECLKEKEHESKTFGENIIFILNRADGTPDSLCVSLLILKILYLLFTTSGTQEFFYTNDLCVLVDVFIRELCDLGEESEGLKHTYLRVLHPLLTNTQLRQHPYKRPQLRRVLESLIAPSHYRDVDPTTRRLVERNLRGSWCQGLRAADAAAGLGSVEGGAGSTLSVDAVASAQDARAAAGRQVDLVHRRHNSRRKSRRQSLDESSSSAYSSGSGSSAPPCASSSSAAYQPSPLSSFADSRAALEPAAERAFAGAAPPDVVRASHAAYTSSPSPSAPPQLAASALPSDYAAHPLAASLPSLDAGRALLEPLAARHLSSSCSPSSSSPVVPPVHKPRPRSTSLSAASYRSSTHGLGLTDSPPPPVPPLPFPSECNAPRRRRPPPPPDASASRPRTPSSAVPAPEPMSSFVPPSPRPGARRRPPPPPTVPGGRGSPRASGLALEGVEDVRRGVEGVAVGGW